MTETKCFEIRQYDIKRYLSNVQVDMHLYIYDMIIVRGITMGYHGNEFSIL